MTSKLVLLDIAQVKPIDFAADHAFLSTLYSALLLDLRDQGLFDETQYRRAVQSVQNTGAKRGDQR